MGPDLGFVGRLSPIAGFCFTMNFLFNCSVAPKMNEQLADPPPSGMFFDTISMDVLRRVEDFAKLPGNFVPSFDISAKLAPKETVVLHPRRIEAFIPVAESKIGGHIYWPRDEAWPKCSTHTDRALIAVMQLKKSDVPSLRFPPGKNFF